MGVKEVFVFLENLGFVNIVIPFVVIFIILYSILDKIKIFKDNKVNAVLAVLVSFIAIAAADVVRNVNLFSYYLILAVFAAVIVFMLIALVGGKLDIMSGKYKKYTSWIVAVLLCLVVLYGLYIVTGPEIDIGPMSFFVLSRLVPIVIAVIVFIAIVWYVSSGKEEPVHARAPREAAPAAPEKAPRGGYAAPDISKMGELPKELKQRIRENPELLDEVLSAVQRGRQRPPA